MPQDPIWRGLASSDGISSWTPLKPQHSNPNALNNQLWCIDFFTPPTPLIIPHRHPAYLESLMPLKNWCSIHARWLKSSLKHSIRFCGIFSKFKTEFIAYRFSKVSSRPDCIYEIHQLCQWGLSRVYSNSCFNCSFEPEIIKIGLSSHKMYSNNILNFKESTPNLLKAPRISFFYSLEFSLDVVTSLLVLLTKFHIQILYFCFGWLRKHQLLSQVNFPAV